MMKFWKKSITNCQVLLLSTLVLSVIMSCGSKMEDPDDEKEGHDRLDPIIERAEVVGVPGLCPTSLYFADGELVAGWIEGKGDAQPSDVVRFAKSKDLGKTWSDPFLTYASEDPLTGVGAGLFPLPDGNWTINRKLFYTLDVVWDDVPDQSAPNWNTLVAGRKFDSYYSFTDDGGLTFSEKRRLSDPVKRNDFAQGNIVELPNGELIWPWGNWGSEPLNGFRRSKDGGLNWEPVVRAWQDPPAGHSKPLAFNETAVAVCLDGTIVAVARVDGAPGNDKRFWQIKSKDNGQTWSAPRQINVSGGSPAMYAAPNGQLWLAYRDGGFGPGLGLSVSDDDGETWRFLYHLRDPMGEHHSLYGHIRYTDEDRSKPWRPAEGIVGYPLFAKLSDTEVYVIFHAMNSTIGKSHPENPPFYIAGNLLRIPQ